MIDIDPNRRIDPLLHETDSIENEAAERVAKIALPFLCLHATTGMIASLGMGGFQAGTIALDIAGHYGEDGWLVFGYKSFRLILVVTSTALSILFPLGQFALSNAYQLALNLYTLVINLTGCEGEEAAKVAGKILYQLIHVASICFATPEWIVLSLLMQIAAEAGQAYGEYAEEGLAHLPEIIACLLLASIRAYSAAPHLKTLHRNYFGKQLSQADWSHLYEEVSAARRKNPSAALIDVESFLIERGISSHIKEIDFKSTAVLAHLKFCNMHFQKCDFTGASFTTSHFHKISADACLFGHSNWINSMVTNSRFNGCDFDFSLVVSAYFQDVTILNSNLSRCYFNDSTLNNLSLQKCKMQETSFLMTSVRDGTITDSDLTDCLLFDAGKQFVIKNCTPNRITKPIVGICWHFKQSGIFTPMIDAALRKHGAIPLRFEYSPEEVDPELLEGEVKRLIAQAQAAKQASMLSIPDEILKRAEAGSQLDKIKRHADSYLKYCDGLALPGGLDIEPEFYQASREDETVTDADIRRSMIEFALVSVAHQNKIPTMGTCRGSQLINVYFGGSLNQHVPGQSGFQQMELTDSSRKEWMRGLVGDGFYGYSAHHQASDQIGRELEVVMEVDGVKKFFVSRDGNFIGSQIHPEIHPTLENEKQLVENLIRKSGVAPNEELKNMLAFYERAIEGNKNIYKFFMEKTREKGRKISV